MTEYISKESVKRILNDVPVRHSMSEYMNNVLLHKINSLPTYSFPEPYKKEGECKMKSFYQAGSIPDDEVLFGDGILWIVCKDGVAKIAIDPQYDNTISLEDIALRYPEVEIVIHEEVLSGEVYRYNKYRDNKWWEIGKTRGFA